VVEHLPSKREGPEFKTQYLEKKGRKKLSIDEDKEKREPLHTIARNVN
jgi:hypothetical protein